MAGASSAAQGDQIQAQNAEDAAQLGQVKASEADASMRRKLGGQLSNILAARAGNGLEANSPTGAAVMGNVETIGDENRTQAVDNIQAQVTSDQAAASFYSQSASNALTGGMFGMLGGLAKGAAPTIPTNWTL